jgi:hypothetical protein
VHASLSPSAGRRIPSIYRRPVASPATAEGSHGLACSGQTLYGTDDIGCGARLWGRGPEDPTRQRRVRRAGRSPERVVSRPLLYGGASAAVLGVLAIPAFPMYLGFTDAGNDTTSSTSLRAYDLVADGCGPGFNGPAPGGSRERRLACSRRNHRPGLDRAREPVGGGVGQRASDECRRRTSLSLASFQPRLRRMNAPVNCSSASGRTPFPRRWPDLRSPRRSPARQP